MLASHLPLPDHLVSQSKMGRQEFPGGRPSCRDACPELWPASRHRTPGILSRGLTTAGQRLEESRVSAPAGGKAKSAAAGLPRGQELVPGHQVCTRPASFGDGMGEGELLRMPVLSSPVSKQKHRALHPDEMGNGILELGAREIQERAS